MNNMVSDNNIEQACLGSALLSINSLSKLVDQVSVEDFFYEKNKIICKILFELHSEKKGIDLLIVRDIINKKYKNLNDSDLMDIYRSVGSSTNIQYYIDRLIEMSKNRKLLNLSTEITDDIKRGKSSSEMLQDVTLKLKEIDKERGKVIYPIEAIIGNDISELALKEHEYVKTGYSKLDELIQGFINTELVILAARPSQGKSTLALNIARNIAEKHKVLFFSLEMSIRFLSMRLIAAEANINANYILHGIQDVFINKKIKEICDKLKKINLHINDQGNLKVENIINMSIRNAEYEKPAIIIVDYVGLVKPSDRKISKHEQIGHVAWALKNFAKEMNIPVLLLAQLNRSVEDRAKQIPRLSDLKESGNLEEHADKVLFIYEEIERSGECEIIVAKNRNGAAGHVGIFFERQFTKFI